jgi:hypothetical protein
MRREDSKNWKAKAEVDYSSYKKYVRGKLELRNYTSDIRITEKEWKGKCNRERKTKEKVSYEYHN